MSSLSIKHGTVQLLEERLPDLKTHILTQKPRSLESSKAPVLYLECGPGREHRMAGSGRSLGTIHGVKQVDWELRVTVVDWGKVAQVDGDAFEALVAQVAAELRASVDLAGLGDRPNEGSQVLNYGQNIDFDDAEPQASGQFIRYQTTIIVGVEELYNA